MKIDARFQADMTFSPNYHGKTKTLSVALRLRTKVAKAEAAQRLGKEFAAIAFAGLIETEDEEGEKRYAHAFHSTKPDLVGDDHIMAIVGHSGIPVRPRIVLLEPVKDEPAVIATIVAAFALEYDTDKGRQLAGDLLVKYGQSVEVEMQARQLELPLEGDKAAGAKVLRMAGTGNWGNAEPV